MKTLVEEIQEVIRKEIEKLREPNFPKFIYKDTDVFREMAKVYEGYAKDEQIKGDQRCAELNSKFLSTLMEIRKHLEHLPRFKMTFGGVGIEAVPDGLSRDKVLSILDHWISVTPAASHPMCQGPSCPFVGTNFIVTNGKWMCASHYEEHRK